jgi:hypothetical protein
MQDQTVQFISPNRGSVNPREWIAFRSLLVFASGATLSVNSNVIHSQFVRLQLSSSETLTSGELIVIHWASTPAVPLPDETIRTD